MPQSKKVNYEALQSYNFDNIDFDIDLGEVDDKKHKQILKEVDEHEKEEQAKKDAANKK